MPFSNDSTLVVEYIDGIVWKLTKKVSYFIDENTVVMIPEGFMTDFASIPQVLWNIWPPTGGMYGKAALVHDYLYRTAQVLDVKTNTKQNITRSFADSVFLQAMKELNIPWYTRYSLYSGVRFGGWQTWNNWRSKK